MASLQAGVDLMVMMPTAGKVIAIRNAVIAAVEDGRLSEARFDEAVLHVIEMKLKHGLVFENSAGPKGLVRPWGPEAGVSAARRFEEVGLPSDVRARARARVCRAPWPRSAPRCAG